MTLFERVEKALGVADSHAALQAHVAALETRVAALEALIGQPVTILSGGGPGSGEPPPNP